MSAIFSHPYGVASTVLRLRSPDFGDDEGINIFTRFKTAMSGDIYSYKSTPAVRTLNLRFSYLTRRKAMELRAFLMASAGDEIGYVDHNGNTWRGYLLNESGEIITDSKGIGDATMRKESNTITLQFEGSIVT